MNFLDHTLPEISKNYLDLLAQLSVKLSEQNQTQIATLMQRVTVLEGNLGSLIKAQSAATELAHKQTTGSAVGAGLPDADKSQKKMNETLMADRYRDNGEGTVTDVTTGLQWMRFSLGQGWHAGNSIGAANTYKWDEARKAVETLNRQTGYAGWYDWRMPTKEELLTLVYCSSGKPKTWNDSGNRCEGNFERPTIFQPAFPNTLASAFWSDSAETNYSFCAWCVDFRNGCASSYARSISFPVRLVRSGK